MNVANKYVFGDTFETSNQSRHSRNKINYITIIGICFPYKIFQMIKKKK